MCTNLPVKYYIALHKNYNLPFLNFYDIIMVFL